MRSFARHVVPLLLPALFPLAQARAADLAFQDRVAAQEAIERVYYAHQIGATKPFDEVVTREIVEEKVRTYLKKTVALDEIWNTKITGEMLQAEVERMARQTRMPDRLREIFAALHDDPVLVEECLARPILVNRLVRERFDSDAGLHQDAHREAGEPSKESWDVWWGREKDRFDETATETVSTGTLPLPIPVGSAVSSTSGCSPDNVWVPGVLQGEAPLPYVFGPAVWTGSVMILWGPSGVRYDPTTDTLTPTSQINAPQERANHTSVWTGSEMIVWGGARYQPVVTHLNTGGRYDPITDTWQPTSTAGAPTARVNHTAVWTGSRMLVYGGDNNATMNDGGSYDPQTNSWTPVPAAPTLSGGREQHAAIWTGSRMLVWGGSCFGNAPCVAMQPLANGARYDPATNQWSPMSGVNAPAARRNLGSVWTGSRMLIWGGEDANSLPVPGGGSYDPGGDSWSPITTANAPPPLARSSVVWAGSSMIAWGGTPNPIGINPVFYNVGGRYDPVSDTWFPTSTIGAPSPAAYPQFVWTGNLMVLWAGDLVSPARYDPLSDTWLPQHHVLVPRYGHSAVWTGNEMIVWGGYNRNDGDRYDPATDSWSSISVLNAPEPRFSGTSTVWTGTEMIVWGGSGAHGNLNSGARYSPTMDAWTPMSLAGAPDPREEHTAVWTGNRMIVWGGNTSFGVELNTGGRYDPGTDAWASTQLTGAPVPRRLHTAVWTGSRMIVWGGYNQSPEQWFDSGGLYDPVANTWTPTSPTNAPLARAGHVAVWTGSLMVVWGGSSFGQDLATGGRYDPGTNSWTPTAQDTPRSNYTAVWAGFGMIVWGGGSYGARYDPVLNRWLATPTVGAPAPRSRHSMVWTGDGVIVWGGVTASGAANNGGILRVNASAADRDGDSYSFCTGDCNDVDSNVHPGALERCNSLDDDCDLIVPANEVDADGDGYYGCANDCDDTRPGVHPGAPELCNSLDDDCNGTVDAFSISCGIGGCTRAGTCVMGVNNCTAGQPSPEVCNGVDDDCDGVLPPNEADADADGWSICQNDCNDANSQVWATPGEVGEVTFASPTSMNWQIPAGPGGSSVLYDVIRSSSKSNFTTAGGATCPYTNGTNTGFLPSATPPLGQAYFFLVRAENACPQGMGSVGTASNGTPRTARTCPP